MIPLFQTPPFKFPLLTETAKSGSEFRRLNGTWVTFPWDHSIPKLILLAESLIWTTIQRRNTMVRGIKNMLGKQQSKFCPSLPRRFQPIPAAKKPQLNTPPRFRLYLSLSGLGAIDWTTYHVAIESVYQVVSDALTEPTHINGLFWLFPFLSPIRTAGRSETFQTPHGGHGGCLK